jgi:aminomuconate-semialdehyde/2-hydroxymuconate-6-semialdehyde dehydrogenase
MEKILNYINGQLREPVNGKFMDNYEPATGKVFTLLPDSDENDVQIAVESAQDAFLEWSRTPYQQRSQLLMKIASLINENLDELAEEESKDNGKPIALARTVDIPRASSNFSFFASAIMSFSSESHAAEDTALHYTLRQPLGIVGAISPWNLPLYLFTWKIAPALAVGNTVVAKPSEITPMTAYLLSKICVKAGLPPGVLNIVHGLGAKVGSAITRHPEINAITFTGGTKTGETIAREAAPKFKKLSLELGGKNPNIIFADCNYDDMLITTIKSSFRNQGEICLCGSRIYVESLIYDKFVVDFVSKTKELTVGDPQDPKTDLGAIVSLEHKEKILSYIKLAQEEGGKIECGGNEIKPEGRCKDGWFVEPTIITGLDHLCRTNQEEIFGPVVTIQPFTTEDEVLQYANSTKYGLASMIWTENLTRAHRLASNIHTGIVWINCWMERDLRTPFGGMKNSGVGREGGFEALRFFTEAKNVTIKLK